MMEKVRKVWRKEARKEGLDRLVRERAGELK